MRRWCVAALVLWAALSGCGSPDEPESRANLGAGGEESRLECAPLTLRRLKEQRIAFSGTVRFERPDADNPDRIDWAIHVDHWYSRDYADVMVIKASDVALGYFSETVANGYALIEDGERLLVAGHRLPGGSVVENGTTFVGAADSCLTRRWSTELAERFERAFSG